MGVGLPCTSLHTDRLKHLVPEIWSLMVRSCFRNATARLLLVVNIFHRLLLPVVLAIEPDAWARYACTTKVKSQEEERAYLRASARKSMFREHHGTTFMLTRSPLMPLLLVRRLIQSVLICWFLGSYLRWRGGPNPTLGDQGTLYLRIDSPALPGFQLVWPAAAVVCLGLLSQCDVTARVRAGISKYLPSHDDTPHFCRLSLFMLALLASCPLKSEAFGYMSSIAAAYGDPGFVCAIKAGDQQEVYCWRGNSTIADGAFDGPQNIGFAGLSGGLGIMCGLQTNTYQPYCWSGNNTGVNIVPHAYVATAYSSIAAGDAHFCAVRGSPAPNPGRVDCWGGNVSGESSPPPTLVSSVVAGRNFTCGLSSAGQTAVCWGSSGNHVTDSIPPVAFDSLAAGANHMCGIIKGTGVARCWGDNSKGQSGPPSIKFTALAGGFFHTCGIREDTQEVECWGNPSFNVSLTSRFLAITGGQVSCGVGEERLIVECWGNGTAYDPPLQLFSPGLCTWNSCQKNEFYFNATAAGFKATSLCADPSQKICSPCAETCPTGSYVSMNCTAGSNLQCMPCSQCQNQVCQTACDQPQARPSSSAPVNGPEPNSSVPGGPQMATLVSSAGKPTGIGLIIGVATGGGLLVFLVGAALTFCVMLRRRGRYLLFTCGSDSERIGQNGLIHLSSSLSSSVGSSGLGRGGHDIVIRTQAFRLTELRDATNGFKEVNELGRGNFGFVYKATLLDGRHVAVKRASAARRIHSNSRDFEAELDILCKLHHANLVNLLGYCEEMGERLLVYEFMPHGTLHDHLHGGLAVLSWGLRVKIALQAARGIEYLHKDASPRIVHKDVKSSNILLDGEWGARVADFGLTLPGNEKGALVSVSEAGYLDPEYAHTQTFTDRSDVYSFGVVLLEILCGRKVIDSGSDPAYIVDWAVPCIQQGKIVSVLDGNLELPKNVDGICRIAEIAELCVRSASCERPGMSDVAGWLEQVARSSPL